MSKPGLSNRRRGLEWPALKTRIFSLIMEGHGSRVIAQKISTRSKTWSWQAIAVFRRRHAAELEQIRERIVAATVDNAISNKEERLRRLEMLWEEMRAIVAKYGYVTKETRFFGDTSVETEVFNAQLVAQQRGLLDDAAKEMGMRRPVVNIDARQQTFNYLELMAKLDEPPGMSVPRIESEP